MKPLLSILIPTVVGREEELKHLYNKIIDGKSWNEVKVESDKYERHLGLRSDGLVAFEIYKDDKNVTIGEKREDMYKDSIGLFSWSIDDDDSIADNAIQLILEEIKSNPDIDCITFEEHIDIDGKIQRSNHSLKYDDWANDTDGFDYVRTPFMKSVIKTEIAKSVPVPFERFGEDHLWAKELKPHLKTEIHIDKQIYKYIHRSSNHEERYGFNKD